jgi:probable HAF family extracellular repeat protein
MVNAGAFPSTTFDEPLGISTYACGINDTSAVVGSYQTSNLADHGFLYSGGNFATLDDPLARFGTVARGINVAGQIVGYYEGNQNDAKSHGFSYAVGSYVTLDDPQSVNGTLAFGISNSGQVVGEYFTNLQHGFIYSRGNYTTIDDPIGVNGTVAHGVNSADEVVGVYFDANHKHHGFIYSSGNFTTLDDPLGTNGSVALGINDAGQIVGFYNDNSNNIHGFLYSSGSFATLDGPAMSSIEPWGITNSGEISGQLFNNTGTHGFTAIDPPNASITVANGDTAELGPGGLSNVVFAGNTGMLQLDQSTSFTGTISGFGGQDRINLGDIAFCACTTLGYASNPSNTGGTLTASDGVHTANIALLGQFTAASFAPASDGHGGTMITDPPLPAQPLLTTPHG